ncbi:MAG TPA: hypothetical protein VGJ53_14075 [Micromonosporaceae bacterium]|jgi:hypothetical protein
MTRTRAIAALLLATTAGPLAGCADPGERPGGEPDTTSSLAAPSPTPSLAAPSPTPSPAEAADGPINPVPAGYTGRFRIAAMVLENAGHGPQVCIGAFATDATVATSDPPLCGGPDVVGWSWGGVPHESRNGTTWGGYVLVGTFDGARFTLTEPARPASSADYPKRPWPDYTSPCPEPPGGWRPVDPKKTTLDTLDRVFGVARALPDYAGLWINQLPPSGIGGLWIAELTVVNVRFTRDLSRHEAELRKVWGGPLCVTSARYTEARLWAIVRELDAPPRRFHYAESDVVRNRIDLGVWVADLAWQQELDARYGPGAVRLVGDLQPLD